MPKKNRSNSVEQLATALEKSAERKVPNPKGGNPPEAYRFAKGQSGNPSGLPRQRQRVSELIERMRDSSPPRHLCEELHIDPSVKWDEAILIVLGHAAMSGDVSAAREVLAALGISGTTARTNVLVNVEANNPAQMRLYQRFLFETRWVPEDQLEKLWELCRLLSQPPSAELADRCLPPSQEEETALLEEMNNEVR